jgi:RNA-directed DNA polymerase
MPRAPDLDQYISTKQQRIAQIAARAPTAALTSLAHHIDMDWMHKAFERTRKDAAPGVDGQTAQQFEANLNVNLGALLEAAKAGTYRASPVRRVHIPKGDGTETPTGPGSIIHTLVAGVDAA